MREGTVEVLTRLVRSELETNFSALTDRDLLHRFAGSGDEAAFAALVARHSRMVLGVCRRQLPTVQDAEDACQATFLILARRARGGRWQSSVANWLYTTARRVVARARRSAARRAKREGRAAVPEAVPALDEISGRELLAVLDEELGKLPALYREPLVLCYLEGLSREDAAARLGVPGGTVKTRLERGRHRLETALTRRGIGPGLGLLALAITSPAEASSPQLADTVRAAVSGSPPAAVAALASGAVMNGALRKTAIVVAVAVSAAGLGIGWNSVAPVAAGHTPGASIESSWSGSSRGPAAAPAVPVRTPSPGSLFAAIAPVPRELEEPLRKEAAVSSEKAIRFLKSKQQSDGTWEGVAPGMMEGGVTALVVVSLLEAGVPAEDPAVARAVKYLADLPPERTYVVSLQIQALAKADPKTHAGRIQTNVDWLLDHAIGFKKTGRLDGWTYISGDRSDGSNTHFAVFALHKAARAGAKVDENIWGAIRDRYIRTQLEDGWAYTIGGGARPTYAMTGAGLVCLAVAGQHEKSGKAADEAFAKGMKRFLAMSGETASITGYQRLVIAELGRLAGKPVFRSGDSEVAWYREGATRLVKDQLPDGSWGRGKDLDSNVVINAAYGLHFLAPPEKK